MGQKDSKSWHLFWREFMIFPFFSTLPLFCSPLLFRPSKSFMHETNANTIQKQTKTMTRCSASSAATTVPPELRHPSVPEMGCRANGRTYVDGEAVASKDPCGKSIQGQSRKKRRMELNSPKNCPFDYLLLLLHFQSTAIVWNTKSSVLFRSVNLHAKDVFPSHRKMIMTAVLNDTNAVSKQSPLIIRSHQIDYSFQSRLFFSLFPPFHPILCSHLL